MCTLNRRTTFTDATIVTSVHDELLGKATQWDIEIIAYCYMPDHLHYLTYGVTPIANALTCSTRFRQRSGLVFKQDRRQRLWQDGYFDRILRDEESTFDVVRYIVNNPVRAGLCRTAADYPFAGSSRYRIEDLVESVQWRPDAFG